MRINFLVLVLVLFQYNWSIAQANEEKKDPAQAVLLSVLWPGKGTIMALGQTIFLVAYLDANSAVKTE